MPHLVIANAVPWHTNLNHLGSLVAILPFAPHIKNALVAQMRHVICVTLFADVTNVFILVSFAKNSVATIVNKFVDDARDQRVKPIL